MTDTTRLHHQAAFTYAGLGILVIIITFVAGLVPSSRRGVIWELAIGGVFVLIFAVLIYRGWWLLSALLITSNLWRAVTYFNDGLGWHLEVLPFSLTRVEPKPIAFLNAALMVIVIVMLARSARVGFLEWWNAK